jgi:hypothetical protein
MLNKAKILVKNCNHRCSFINYQNERYDLSAVKYKVDDFKKQTEISETL